MRHTAPHISSARATLSCIAGTSSGKIPFSGTVATPVERASRLAEVKQSDTDFSVAVAWTKAIAPPVRASASTPLVAMTAVRWQFNYYNLTSIGWNDDIESWKSYAGCRTSVWEHANEGGAKLGPYTNRRTLGVLANNASSIRWAL